MVLAEQLVGEARQRRARELDRRESRVTGLSALLYLAVAVAIALGFLTFVLLGVSTWLKEDRWLIASIVMSLFALGLVSCTLMSPVPLKGPP